MLRFSTSNTMKILSFFSFFLLFASGVYSQNIPVTIDANGRMRNTNDKKEARFFGTNYTLPFAHAYRAHKTLGLNHEQAIQNDVYHFYRLGFNAFRVHVWDVEITDSAGNLLENEHLRLFDFLLAELKKYNIKALLTPIAFWGNGYPEPDEATPGFATGIHKRLVLRNEDKTAAQENYIRQFVQHINPYTGMSYAADPDIIAMEINNEPHHSGPPELTTEYINRLAASARNAGWQKPVFYNISESPSYAEAVLNADINGVSFQWYPTGLVAGRSHKGNFYPNMSRYEIPWKDHPKMKNKALMVYEFDAGDLMSNYGFPAMTNSFKNAGFQWATHFAYDPMGIAYANTEYQTHYVNLAYTPSKAISMLIAARLFRSPEKFEITAAELQNGPLTINPAKDYSEWNEDTAFYYTGNTESSPKNLKTLKHIAGTGNSPLVQYSGTGAYFLDKISDGVWRLEIMPDAVPVKDPFERASLSKTVTSIIHNTQTIGLQINELGKNFMVRQINKTEDKGKESSEGKINLKPGAYLVYRKDINPEKFILPIHRKFVSPIQNFTNTEIRHEPPLLINAGSPLKLSFLLSYDNKPDSVKLEINDQGRFRNLLKLEETEPYKFTALLKTGAENSGPLRYRLFIYSKGKTISFPGAHEGQPYRWDNYKNEYYETLILTQDIRLPIFLAERDREKLILYQPDWNNGKVQNVLNNNAELALKFAYNDSSEVRNFGFEFYCGDIMEQFTGRNFNNIFLEANQVNLDSITLNLIHDNGESFGVTIKADQLNNEINISLEDFRPNEMYLLPRPYPGFQPLLFQYPHPAKLNLKKVRKLQIIGKASKNQKKEFMIKSVFLY